MRYRLRTLLIVLALGPPLIWGAWKAEEHRRRQEIRRLVQGMKDYSGDSLRRVPTPSMDYERVKWKPASGGSRIVSTRPNENRSPLPER